MTFGLAGAWRRRIAPAALALLLGSVRFAAASCDQIPGTANTFRGLLGNVSRPFASPRDYFEIRLSPTCDTASSGFATDPAGNVVSFVFKPPAGPRHVVVLAADCDALESERATCAGQPDVADV